MVSNLDHVERTFAEAYRKEIDQEENVWRSLPFFAAALALQLAALFQIAQRLPARGVSGFYLARGCLIASAVCTVFALGCLSLSILPVRFRYIAPEPELLKYADGLEADEAASKNSDAPGPDSLVALKKALAFQYAVATHHNRQVNQRRARRRSIAGLATLLSVFLTLLLVGVIIWTHVPVSG